MAVLLARYYGIDKQPLLEKYKDKKILELDKEFFQYLHPTVSKDSTKLSGSIHPNFPENFIQRIREELANYDIIIVFYNNDLLRAMPFPFTLIYPALDYKTECLDNVLKAGYSEHVTNSISKAFDEEIALIESKHYTKVAVHKGETILTEEATKIIDYYLPQGEAESVAN